MDVKAIDGHRHIVVKEAVAAASKLNPAKSINIYPSGVNERSEEVNRKKGEVSGTARWRTWMRTSPI